MVMTGGEGTDGRGRRFVDRNTFYDIGAGSFKWRKDRSFDGGESWIEGVAHIDCRAATGNTGRSRTNSAAGDAPAPQLESELQGQARGCKRVPGTFAVRFSR